MVCEEIKRQPQSTSPGFYITKINLSNLSLHAYSVTGHRYRMWQQKGQRISQNHVYRKKPARPNQSNFFKTEKKWSEKTEHSENSGWLDVLVCLEIVITGFFFYFVNLTNLKTIQLVGGLTLPIFRLQSSESVLFCASNLPKLSSCLNDRGHPLCTGHNRTF